MLKINSFSEWQTFDVRNTTDFKVLIDIRNLTALNGRVNESCFNNV